MHPSLRLSKLSKLPSALRKRATAAASGSQGEFLKLAEELRAALIPPEHSALLLPAFYATLGTAEIPLVLEQLDTTSMQIETIRVRIVQVLGNLKMMAILGGLKSISTAAFVDLWLRVWPWIEFLDEYQDHLPGIEHFSQTERYSVYLALLLLFRREDETSVLMDSMAGPYAILGKAWSHFVHRYEEDAAHLQDVCLFLSFSRVLWGDARGQDPTIPFEGLITGAGGTRTDFASLVVSHLIRIVTDPPFVGTAAIILVLPQEGRDPSLRDALLAQGIVRALTTAALAFSSGPSDVRATVLKGILTSLVNYLGCFPRHRWVTESLRAGLLGVVFSSPHLPKSGDFLRALLRPGGVLPRSTVYHSVLSQPRLSLLEVRDRNAAAAFGDPEILEHWVHFLGLAEKRFQLVDLYHAGSSNAMRACDNLKVSAHLRSDRQHAVKGLLGPLGCMSKGGLRGPIRRADASSLVNLLGSRNTCRGTVFPY
ncbi:hypothetical protein DFH06DRAFT_1153910 [Mycena polygramma]|nr:hypothetical protein DFH06DRAFT_1153910 [Mycena polygramma]